MTIGLPVRFLFILFSILILILFYRKALLFIRFSQLKKKVKNNPLVGTKASDGGYCYKERGYAVIYKIKESPAGNKGVKWLSFKRRLGFLEEKGLSYKKDLDKFFLYQRWFILFRPCVAFIFVASLIFFYWGIREDSLRRIERFKWIVAQITGVSPESVDYTGQGWLKISGQKHSLAGEVDPVKISFNPLAWLFSPNAARVSFWSKKLDKYVSYPVTVSEQGDVWLRKGEGQIHGSMSGEKVIWDEPQRAGIRDNVSGHRITIEDGKLKIFDE